jgi:pyruvate-ferredoxin/flavodoxin oxidoreductase
MVTADAIREVVLQAESAVSTAVFSTGPASGDRHTVVATGAEAVLAAAAHAHEGRRAAAALRPSELLASLEALHAVARSRAPIVVHVLGAPAGAGTLRPGRDELSPALDCGAGVICTWSAQDSLDLTLAARRAAEDSETPFVIFTDGDGPVMSLPGPGLVERFLGDGSARAGRPSVALAPGEALYHVESKLKERSFAARVPFALTAAMRELGELTGRHLGALERFETSDAEEVIIAVGHAYQAARAVAEGLRREGRRVGAVGVRALRPFFAPDVVKAVARARSIAVLEPLDAALAPAGPIAQALKAAFADAITWAPGFPGVGRIPTIISVAFATIDGAVADAHVRQALAELGNGDRARRLLVLGSEG